MDIMDWPWRRIILLYVLSIGLTYYQYSFVNELHLPFTILFGQFITKFLIAFLIRKYKENTLKVGFPSRWIVAVGIMSAGDIGLTHCSYQYINVALVTMIKNSSIIVIIIFSIFSRWKKWNKLCLLPLISIGLGIFFVMHENTNYNSDGVWLAAFASFCCGLRVSGYQMLLQRMGVDSKDVIFYVQPCMILTMLVLIYFFELETLDLSCLFLFDFNYSLISNIVIVAIGGFIAFLLELAEFSLISATSSEFFSVVGVVKEAVTILFSFAAQSSDYTGMNLLGFVVCITGVVVYGVLERKTQNQLEGQADDGDADQPLIEEQLGDITLSSDRIESVEIFMPEVETVDIANGSFNQDELGQAQAHEDPLNSGSDHIRKRSSTVSPPQFSVDVVID